MEKKLAAPPEKKNNHKDLGQESRHEMTKKMELQRRQARTYAKKQQLAERIASASEQLSAGVEEASQAAGELRQAMEQIASGADEAASATQESLAAIKQIEKGSLVALQRANESLDKINALQELVKQIAASINKMVDGVLTAAIKNEESAQTVAKLEKQAENIGGIVRTVVRIADQTNLLALNAAIEAARAGDYGKGFAVVADEVRTLAETSEKAAEDIRNLINNIQNQVRDIASDITRAAEVAKDEANKGRTIQERLIKIIDDMTAVKEGSKEIAELAEQASLAVKEFQEGASSIAQAADEQASATNEALASLEQQVKALDDITMTVNDLVTKADELRTATDVSKSSESLAASAEELTAVLEEADSAASQIMTAIGQMAKAAQIQAEATEHSSTSSEQVLRQMTVITEKSEASLSDVNAMSELLETNRAGTENLIEGINAALTTSLENAKKVQELELQARQIDKIVDSIVTVGIQTNLLAVTGAVEAARSGDFGKGFAVVASDIRNLAQESAKNAEQIKELVRNIQDQIGLVKREVETVAGNAAKEVEAAKQVVGEMQKIKDDMAAVAAGSEEIKENSLQAVSAVEQARKAVEQIASAAQEASAASEQAFTASKQQAQGMQELAKGIEEIAAMADELQQL
ncbi:methyl-accepting chemotaxis protein [Zhaonella formicivorans]|uniref:methyl-accepting chemotaxis protein n=1 Tax=Zhaonella formicivorans TaxID=2528593 RepID=UPI001D0FB476|nr:methyl-accepting chemotaxis protein [Zhaonella formicivorans]